MTGRIVDLIEIRGRVALEYGATGLVILVTGETGSRRPAENDPILLVRQDGWLFKTVARDCRPGPDSSYGFFVVGLTREDVPESTEVRWGDQMWPVVDAA